MPSSASTSAVNAGLGVAMIQSQSSFDVPRTWGLAVVMGLTVGVVYAAMGILSRVLLPWAAGERPLSVLQLAPDGQG